MRNKAESKKGQSGQILIYTTIIVMLAALILVPLMQFAFTSHRSAQIRQERTLELYASDAGIEDALYQIKTEKKGTDLANLGFGNTSAYNTGTPDMNDRTVDVGVQKVWIPQDLPGNLKTDTPVDSTTPSLDTDKSDKLVVVGMLQTVQATAGADDFDHGWPDGVSQIDGVNQGNWTGNWTTTGSASLASGGKSVNCLNFTGSSGTAMRQTILPKYMKPELQFWVKGSSFGSSDTVACEVSIVTNPIVEDDWTTVMTWGMGNVTGSWPTGNCTINLYDKYGIGDYSVAKPLWVRFVANLSAQTSHDDFENGFPAGYQGEWIGNWTQSGTGAAGIVSTGIPYGGTNHLKITQYRTVYRKVLNFSSLSNPYLYLYVKGSGFSSSDKAYVEVSTNGSTWNQVGQTLSTSITSLGSYTLYSIPIPSNYWGASNFWIRLRGGMGSTSTFASEGFESGLSGASGIYWIGSWTPSISGNGAVNVVTGYARSGSRSLELSRSGSSAGTASATRILNVSGQDSVQLQFYARSRSIESSDDNLFLQVSPDNVNWTSTTIIGNTTSYNNSYSQFTYTVPSSLLTTGLLYVRFNANMARSSGDNNDYFYIDDISVVGNPYYYVDNVSVSGTGPSFSVDNLWAGYQANSNDIEIAYTDLNLGNAFLDRVGVWMPPGCNYMAVVGNETSVELNHEPTPPTPLLDTYAGGTILEWDFASPGVALHQPSGQLPIVKTLTFTYGVDVAQTVEGMFIWIKAHGPSGQSYISWDKGYEIYKAVSQAHSEIYGTNTQVTAYAAQGEVNKSNMVTYGDYVATGNSLLIDSHQDDYDIRDLANTPSYSTISTIPSDAEVKGAWLYWSAFQKNSAVADTECDFMYPKEYGPETFAVQDGNGNDAHTTAAYTAHSEPIVTLPRDIVVNLNPRRYCAEILGTAYADNGNDTFTTLNKPVLQQPQAKVWVESSLLTMGTDYVIDYNTGNVTIIKNVAGQVKINYNVSGLQTLTPAGNYTVNYASGLVTITNDCLAGNVTIDYWASHWSHNDPVPVTHDARDQYGTALPAVVEENDDGQGHLLGWSYVCFRDVTDLVKGTGNGQFGVGQVDATTGDEHEQYVHGNSWPQWCYSAWSIIIVYDSPSETAHQLYLYDPIHNSGTCHFYSGMDQYISFTLNDFYPPAGLAEGRLTYFVGEGDDCWDTGENISFNGDQLHGNATSPNPYDVMNFYNNPNSTNNIMNNLSTTGEAGVDIDSWNIKKDVGSATSASVKFHTGTDSWNLCYIVLSFKTDMKPKTDYAFNVASVTYQYELGN